MQIQKPSDQSDASVLKRIITRQFQRYITLLTISDDDLHEIYCETLAKLEQTGCHAGCFVNLVIKVREADDLLLETESVLDASLQQLRNELGSCLNSINKRLDKRDLGALARLL